MQISFVGCLTNNKPSKQKVQNLTTAKSAQRHWNSLKLTAIFIAAPMKKTYLAVVNLLPAVGKREMSVNSIDRSFKLSRTRAYPPRSKK